MKAALAAFVLFAAAACAAALARPTAADAERAAFRWPGVTLTELEQGRSLYALRCSSCHPLYLPGDVPSARWGPVLDQMAPRARLTADERRAVERFLVTLAWTER